MSKPRQAEAVKLMMSVISAEDGVFRDVMQILAVHFGRPDFISARMLFDYTNYYEKEMGENLIRRIVSFDKLIAPESLPDVKLLTNQVEDQFSGEGQRKINIDPGYMSAAHLILATGKGYTHRPYLRDGIYADLTLIFTDGAFRALAWTYPDYAGQDVTTMLHKIRGKYIDALKAV
ncbi:MAG: DUF4416 domain-containing protein [Syntrophus sp. (in: bacteria)]|nr:DUF4416 domain-containing protein [Syntrophus sp. (in: bacteria)]